MSKEAEHAWCDLCGWHGVFDTHEEMRVAEMRHQCSWPNDTVSVLGAPPDSQETPE